MLADRRQRDNRHAHHSTTVSPDMGVVLPGGGRIMSAMVVFGGQVSGGGKSGRKLAGGNGRGDDSRSYRLPVCLHAACHLAARVPPSACSIIIARPTSVRATV